MSITVVCECGESFEAPESAIGGRARCPHCGREPIVLKPAPPSDVLFIGEEPATTSNPAVFSFLLGVCLFMGCLGGIPAILIGQAALRQIDGSGGRLKGRRLAKFGIGFGVLGCLLTVVALLMPATRSAREAARRSYCMNNLKQIGIAIHNYHDGYGCLPPSSITDKAGKPLLSWRVAILPFVEASPLFAKFHLDEPWNSPHNLTLLDQMPSLYACPSDPTLKGGNTGYQVFVAPRSAFPPDHGRVTFDDITDGTSNTILVGESNRLVPWTKPEDLTPDQAVPLSGLGSHHGYHNNGFNTLFFDGSVKFLKPSIKPGILDALLTRDGKESLSPDEF